MFYRKDEPIFLFELTTPDSDGFIKEPEDKDLRLKTYKEKANQYITNLTTTGCMYTDENSHNCEECLLDEYFCKQILSTNYLLLKHFALDDKCLLTQNKSIADRNNSLENNN